MSYIKKVVENILEESNTWAKQRVSFEERELAKADLELAKDLLWLELEEPCPKTWEDHFQLSAELDRRRGSC